MAYDNGAYDNVMVAGLLFQDHPQEVTDRVRSKLENLLQRARAPEEVRAFLMEHWAHLLVSISLERGESNADWAAGWDTVQALLWSLEPKSGLADTEQLLGLLPLLLERLQDGCAALGLNDAERDAFFSELAMQHAAIVRAGLRAAREVRSVSADMGTVADRYSSRLSDLPASESDIRIHGKAGLDEVALNVRQLTLGDQVCFVTSEGEKTLNLQWVSTMQGMFLFADADGYNALSLTRARLQEKVNRGEARLLGENSTGLA